MTENIGHDSFAEDIESSGRMSARPSTRKRTLESLGQRSPSLRTKRIREDNGSLYVDATSAFSPSEESDHSESEGARRRNEKGCRCGRTKCLKQYCACFRNDIRCTTDCVCRDCNNDGFHEEARMKAVRMTRLNDPSAFKGTSLELENREVLTPRGTLKTVRGCRCRRSKCQKKYCECFGAGLLCGSNCVCEDCLNFEPQDKSQGGHEAAPVKYARSESAAQEHMPTREEAQAVAERSAALKSRRPFISVQVRNPASEPAAGGKVKRMLEEHEEMVHEEMVHEEMTHEEEHEGEEEPPEWEDSGDLNCDTMLSARSTLSEPAEGTKGMPLQARNGWEGEEDARAAEWADEPRFALLKERSQLFSPSGGQEYAPLSRNVSAILGDELPSMSRNASGVVGFGRFESMDWTLPAKDELDAPEEAFSLARQLSNGIGSLLA